MDLCHLVIFNKWDEKIRRYNFIGVICANKLGTYIRKDLINIGTKLLCNFPQFFSHGKQFVTKWFRQKEYQNAWD
jgi:hypothetical protein